MGARKGHWPQGWGQVARSLPSNCKQVSPSLSLSFLIVSKGGAGSVLLRVGAPTRV